MARTPVQLSPDTQAPNVVSGAHTYMRDRLRILRAVFAGTAGLIAIADDILPSYEKERPQAYSKRKKLARLRRNMFRQSVERITGRIFQVPVSLVEPQGRGKEIADDFDLRGNSLDRVARTFYAEALKLGMYGGLVEYPVVSARNLAEERLQNPRPYLVMLAPEDILRCYVGQGGEVTHLAWETRTVDWDDVRKTEVETVRIHERFAGTGGAGSTARTWVLVNELVPRTGPNPRAAWRREGEDRTVVVPGPAPGRVMFEVFYAEREGHMIGRTPLTEVADLTIEHFQIASDYRGALRSNLFPVLTATGVKSSEMGDVVFNPETILQAEHPQAKFNMLEHNGSALESGFRDLESLESRAEAYAGRLTKPTGTQTATGEAINTAEVSSFAKDMALSLQDFLQKVLDHMAVWEGVESLGKAQVNLDFAVDFGDSDMSDLQSMRGSGDLSRQTLWREARRRNKLGPDFDEDEETRLLEDEQAESMKRERDAMSFASRLASENDIGAATPARGD